MNDTVKLNKSKVVLFRRIICALSFAGILTVSALLLAGYITFRGRNMTAIVAVNNALDFMKISERGFWSSVISISVSIVYVSFAIKSIVAIISYICKINVWAVSKSDTERERSCMIALVKEANHTIVRFFVIYVLSFITVDDCCTCVLTEWKLTFSSNFGIAQHCQCNKLVVFACFGVI